MSASAQRVGHVVLAGGLPPRAAIRRLKETAAPRSSASRRPLAIASKLVRTGADAIVIEGMEAGGHIGPVSTSVLAQEILPHRDRGAGVRRRRHRPRRGDPVLSGDGRRRRAARHPLRLRHESIAHPRFKQAFIRAAARDAVPSVQIDPRFPGDPGARAGQRRRPRRFTRDPARGDRPVQPRRADRRRRRSSRSSISGPARCAAR